MTSINHNNNLCLVTLHVPSSTSCNCPDHVPPREPGKKFGKILNLKNTSNNNPTNILNNLCTGLETFLGFNKDSKGYDGSGIVYSDLDRLCDGVMGFLSGVLDAVKNENEVITYDQYISGDNNRLKKVLDTLTKNIGSGRAGLAESVRAVKGWLEGYEREVNNKITAVTEPIEIMKNLVEHDKNEIKIEKDKNLITQVEEWTKRAKQYVSLADKAKKALKDIDPTLSGKLNNNISLLVQATGTFKAAAENGDLKDVYEEAGKQIYKVVKYAETEFGNTKKLLLNYLNEHITALHDKLVCLQRAQFDDLFTSVNNDLLGAYDKVSDGIKDLEHKYRISIFDEVHALQSSSHSFKLSFETAQRALSHVIIEIKGDMEKFRDLKEVNNIDVSLRTRVKLLNNLQNDPFKSLRDYFEQLESPTTLLALALAEIGKGMDTISSFTKKYEMGKAIKHAATALKELKSCIEGEGDTQLPNTNSITIGGEMITVGGADNLRDTLRSHMSNISNVLQKIETSPTNVNIGDTTAIFSDLSSVAEALSSHSKEIVDAVMKKITTQVTEDIQTVATYIHQKMEKMANAIDFTTEGKTDYGTYGGGAQHAAGLKKLVNEFQNAINQKLIELHGNVGKNEEHEGSVYKDLVVLRKNITALATQVDVVKENVRAVAAELSGCIRKSTRLVNHAPRIAGDMMNKLQTVICGDINKGFQSVQQKAKTLFTETKQNLTAALQKIVNKQIKNVTEIVYQDSISGMKSFCRRLKTYFVNEIASLYPHPYTPHEQTPKSLQDFSKHLTSFYHLFLREVNHSSFDEKLDPVSTKLETLLKRISDSKHFDYLVSHKYNDLQNALDNFAPKKFSTPCSPLLAPLKRGLSNFAQQLGHAYVNRYSGKQFEGELLKEVKSTTPDKPVSAPKQPSEKIYVLTPEGRNCAKVCLTIVEMVYHNLDRLRVECNGLTKHQINKSTDIGRLFSELGFKVSEKGEQNGELHDDKNKIGDYVFKRIMWPIKKAVDIEHLHNCESRKPNRYDNFHIFDILRCIYSHFEQYNEVCHIATSSARRQPCSVYEMLIWLTGLPYASVYGTMRDITLSEFFEDSTKQVAAEIEGIEMTLTDIGAVPIQACPRDITYSKVTKAITHICAKAYDVLASIAGHGDEYTLYASDYCNNSLGLKYPSSGQDCLDMLLDVLRRCLPALRYIFQRCNVTAEHHGWRNCEYGKDVPTAKSHCSNKATSQPNSQPKSEAKCQPTSPLMSYLNDCLPGHLPHNVSSIGCRSVCSNCPSAAKLGMPCLTPMGFRGFSGSTKSGADLCEIIREFFGSGLVASLLGLSPTPPKTLPEHFGFALSLVNGWVNITNLTPEKRSEFSFQSSFESRIRDVSLKLYPDSNKLIKTLMRAYGSQAVLHEYCKHPHLVNFTSSDICRYDVADVACAPYLQSLCSGSYEYMAIKHCELYLTWAIYLSWDFWRLLNNLYNDFCNIFCADWGCRGCLRGDTCKKGSHGRTDEKTGNPHCQCPSIVDCNGVSPTLYRYGFSFCDAVKLNDSKYKKKCSDFCSQLNKLLTSQYFKDLFKECDNFIWTIREPFTYLVLALWSLSLFYLICVMVGRLDVLHIRSHLRIPSSHKITAQSLLAAAQVGRLAKISYLQP
ncbi:hypothetical protein, conserved [Babesia bigemina]|uniref:C3H1-type domain-containing protein n=1 Tax=Babesia bigemina TaxID=5866 RepID=A0A061BTE1_BABBI|nr:hypothetical protein, conserved [Babesia bigemina]CDR71779.1 hypothetical protein, conserved [Babesia bigemina]|eukprot:XP_012770723.1 hypothetical protein, conserved [Babesia bigemina]